MTAARRLFVAIDLPAELRGRLAGIVAPAVGVRPARPQALHLTLHFLGDVPAALERRIVTELGGVRMPPFTLRLAGRGRFPPRGPARVLWVGLEESRPLASLHATIGAAIARAGIVPEARPYLPHVSVARLDPAAAPAVGPEFLALSEPPGPAFPVDHVTLYASRLEPAGAVHEPVHVLPLVG